VRPFLFRALSASVKTSPRARRFLGFLFCRIRWKPQKPRRHGRLRPETAAGAGETHGYNPYALHSRLSAGRPERLWYQGIRRFEAYAPGGPPASPEAALHAHIAISIIVYVEQPCSDKEERLRKLCVV